MDGNEKVVTLLTEIRDNQLKQLEYQESAKSDLAEQKLLRDRFFKRTWPRLIIFLMLILLAVLAFLVWISIDFLSDQRRYEQQWEKQQQLYDQHV